MACYSHSRISTFEQCKYKYKLQYIDKVKVEIPTTIEAFMGDLVHRTLEKLYSELQYQKNNTLQELLRFFNEVWQTEWSEDILIAKKGLTADNYRKMGEAYISMFYERYHPFDQMTILGLETEERMTLSDGNQYHVRIDKLCCKGDTYYVCDYKTNSRMKNNDDADGDRQLAMYSIWVKDKFKDAKKVVLLWHMLAFDKEVTSERTEEQLEELHQEVVQTIKEIEECKEWPTHVTALCDYCIFKSICPSFKHELELEQKSVKEFKADDGVKMVDELAEIELQEKALSQRKEEIKSDLILLAQQKEIDIVYGSNKKASVKPYLKVVYPENKIAFIRLLREKGLYDDVSMISYPRLNAMILKKEIDPEVIEQTTTDTDYRISLSKKREAQDE